MRNIIGAAFVSLDGVMQAPGGPTEDWTGGFTKGGWLAPMWDDKIGETLDHLFTEPFDLLLGQRTYDIFAAYWPYVEGDNKPMGETFDRIAKYVVTHRDAPLEWHNSYRIGSLDALADLKKGEGPDLIIQGSSTLYPQLLAAGLIDRLTLMTFPVVLGEGKRLFGAGTPPVAMTMVDQRLTPRGNIIATYAPDGDVKVAAIGPPSTSQREQDRQEQMKLAEAAA